jgi:hypothetical protein
MASEVISVKRTHLKGKPPILTDGDSAIEWAVLQGMDRGRAENLFDTVAILRGNLWRTYFIREVARYTYGRN